MARRPPSPNLQGEREREKDRESERERERVFPKPPKQEKTIPKAKAKRRSQQGDGVCSGREDLHQCLLNPKHVLVFGFRAKGFRAKG